MNAGRWARVSDVFAEALALPETERAAFLAEATDGDGELLAEVESLLEAHFSAGESRLEAGALDAAPDLAAALATAVPGMHIGPYRVLGELGRGGMGAVYRAERDDGTFSRQVAIKLIKRGMDSEAIVRRFLAERKILAGLVHPHIARLLDGGATADGRPYFVMELVAGRPVTQYAEEAGLSLEDRLRLFLKIAGAVQLAHQNLVVHRDLKPANILVGEDGEPKLLDFGIAKLLGPETAGETVVETAHAERPMTPDYASPEQRAGAPVTTATDVYGLGVLLYELLVGRSPASVARRLGGGDGEIRPPSEAVRALDHDGGAQAAGRLSRRLAGDLDAIAGKALAADPGERYGTAAALAEDVARHLARLPVSARRPTLAYRLGRAVRRHKLAAAAVLAGVTASGAVTYQAVELARARDRAEAQRASAESQRQRAESLLGVLLDLFRSADPDRARGASLTVREVLDTGAPRLLTRAGTLAHDRPAQTELLYTVGTVYSSLGLYREADTYLTRAAALARPGERAEELAAADALTQLGHLARETSAFPRARALYRRALAIKKRWLGSRALATVDDLNGLGVLALEQAELARAAPLFAAAAAISRQVGPAGRQKLAESLNNESALARAQGDLDTAEARLREASEIDREVLGDDHPEALRGLSNLVVTLQASGKLQEAEALARQVLATRRRILGPDHPDIALSLSVLAVVLERRGDPAGAEQALREALAMRGRLGLSPSPHEAQVWNSLGAVLRQRGAFAEAEAACRQSERLYRQLLGDHHPALALVWNNLSLVRQAQGDLTGAERLIRQGLAVREGAYGGEHPDVVASVHRLAEVLEDRGRMAESEAAYRQAVALRRRLLPPGHADLGLSIAGLGGLLTARGRTAEAITLLEEALALYREALPPGHRFIARAEGDLGECRAREGRLDVARPLLEASYRGLLAARGPGHPETREALARLGRYGIPIPRAA